MKYKVERILEVREMTCGEALDIRKSGEILYQFIPFDFPDEICEFNDCWDWIENSNPKKKIFLIIDEIKSTGKVIK
jgi:hypothetical protein